MYSKQDYERCKTILFHRNLDGSVIRIEIPGMGADITDMLEHFKGFMQAMTYHIDGEFQYVTREDMEAEARARKEYRDRMDREIEESDLTLAGEPTLNKSSCCPHENIVFGRVRDSI